MKVKQRSVCQTCRTRKLGCDGKRPECSQCVLTGRRCDGYQSDWTFVLQNGHSSTSSSVSKQRDTRMVTPQEKRENLVIFGPSRNRYQVTGAGFEAGLLPGPVLNPTQPLWDDLLGLVVKCYIPEDEMTSITDFSDSKRSRICGSWLAVLPKILGKSDRDCVLRATIRALATSILSQNPQMGGSSLDRVESYDTAIQAVRKGLTVSGYAFHAVFIAAIMCIALAEIMFPDSAIAFAAHVNGIGHILQTQRVEQYRSGVFHGLFVGFRPILIVQAFRCRQPTFLASEPWIRVPFSAYRPSPMQSLLSEAATIPSLLQQIDMLLNDPCQGSSHDITKLLRYFMAVLNNLGNWEIRLRTENTEPHYWSVSPGTQITEAFHQEYIWFPNITMANVHTHLWAFRIICLSEINKLTFMSSSFIHDNQSSSWQFDFDNVQEYMITLSKQICMSMEYLIQDGMRLFGPASTFFPLQTAYRTFKMDELRQRENVICIEDIVDRLVKKGLQSAPHIVFGGLDFVQTT